MLLNRYINSRRLLNGRIGLRVDIPLKEKIDNRKEGSI